MAGGDPLRPAVHGGALTMSSAQEALEARAGYVFRDRALLAQALIHASADAGISNERLEFLGDRVLGLVIASHLHERFPDAEEGSLSLRLNALVRKEACGEVGKALQLEAAIRASAGEARGAMAASIIADATEALIGAIFLDGGYKAARDFVLRHWQAQFERPVTSGQDAKTRLQEWTQARLKGKGLPQYRELSRSGSDHAPVFSVEVSVAGTGSAVGLGPSKRQAEQDAAQKLLEMLGHSGPNTSA